MNVHVEFIKTLGEENHSEFKKTCSLIAKDLQSGQFTVLQLIEELKEFLINPSPSKREKGVSILTEVLQNLPPDFLNVQQLNTVSVFYKERLSDHHQIVPVALKGLLRLIEFKHFPEELLPPLLTTIFHNVACQQQQQADRYTIFEIYRLSLEKYKDVLLTMELDLVYGIISSIDGERDPRNLLFLFKWLKNFLASIPLGHLTEEMFEVMACYFPIDFKTPPSSVMNVTREDLAEALCTCLCAIPQFAEHNIPLALDKLESSLKIAKLDSLKLLKEGCSVFPASSYLLHATEIWSQLQKEVFSDVDDDLKEECLDTLTKVINKMSESDTERFVSVVGNIIATLKGNLLPDSKLFEPSISILLHAALGSQRSSIYVAKEILPLLTNTFVISHNPAQKVVLLKTLVRLIKAYSQHNKENVFAENERSVVPVLCLKACTDVDSSFRSAGYESLADLAEILTVDIRLPLYEHLHAVIVKPEPTDVRLSILKCLKALSEYFPNEIDNHILYKSRINEDSVLHLYLNAICCIAHIPYFAGIVSDSFLSYAVDNSDLATVAVSNMTDLLTNSQNGDQLSDVFVQKQAVDKLVEYAVTKVRYGNDTIQLLVRISSILKILIGPQSTEVQSEILERQLKAIEGCRSCEEMYVLLLDGLVSRRRGGSLLEDGMFAFLTRLSVTNGDDVVRDVGNQLLANLINKHPDGDRFTEDLDGVKRDCSGYMGSCRSNVMVTLSWVTKALVMRNHSQANAWMDMLLNYLEQDDTVAKGFRIIMNDDYESLGSISHCDRKLLYRQKVFILATNRICDNYSQEKVSYLIALGYLIEFVSDQALHLQFKKISRLVILCLEQCTNAEVLCVVLKRIQNILIVDDGILPENLEDLLMRILRLAAYEHSMNVRMAALKCIIQFSSLPLYKILPLKQKVVQHLGACIDDKKRLVRKEASQARSLWYLLDAPM